MKHDHFIVQSPATPAQQLLLLFHGVGDNPVSMGQIGSWFAPQFPNALIVSIGGAEPCGPAPARQWFFGARRDGRKIVSNASMPLCRPLLKRCATGKKTERFRPAGDGADRFFSQGAIMSLESIKSRAGAGVACDCL